MLILTPVCKNTELATEVEDLSLRAFPPEEWVSQLPLMEEKNAFGQVLAILQDGRFVGFLSLLTVGELCHIVYFAVSEAQRSKGIGRAALSLLSRQNPGKRILVDIENPAAHAENHTERLRRKSFYLRCGFSETEVRYTWRKVAYEILCYGGTVTREEFWSFWDTLSKADEAYSQY